MNPLLCMHVFCHVVDNYGDIGVCWRVSRQCVAEHGLAVTLWIDDLISFQRICPAVDITLPAQQVDGVWIRHWRTDDASLPEPPADIVIEGFGCQLPAGYVAAMAARETPVAWFNLEYLSAEPWVEECHQMVSVHPSLPLKKYFFFPGFTDKTGGLPCEAGLLDARDAFMADPAQRRAFLATLGVPDVPDAHYLSLFCYPDAPVHALLDYLSKRDEACICLIPEGIAQSAVTAWAGSPLPAGASLVRGKLALYGVPFVEQSQYDKLLWSCDMNFIRGEDSFVRAQWAGKPFVWHIYPQEEGAHLVKLDAFLALYAAGMSPPLAGQVSGLWHAWNRRAAHQSVDFPDLIADSAWQQWQDHAGNWCESLIKNGDLAGNLISFAKKIG